MAGLATLPRGLLVAALVAALPAIAHAAAPGGDAAKGGNLFKQRCGVCHAVVDDGAVHPGPLLKGVVGRKAGSIPTFKYSKALRTSGLTWDRANLDKFLANPLSAVPGTFMVISVPNRIERQDIVAYLARASVPSPAAAKPAPAKTK